MHVERLREFVTLGQNLSFSRAAQQLHISQSTLTRHVAAIEDELGVPLLTRTTRVVELTDAGKVFLERASAVYESYEDMVADVRSAFGTQAELRIAYPYYFAEAYLQPALDAFAKRFPSVQPKLSPIQPQDADELLLQDACDVSFEIVFPYAAPNTRYHGRIVGTVPMAVMLRTSNPLAKKSSLCASDLDGACFVNPSSYDAFNQFADEYCARNGIAPGTVARASSVELIYPTIVKNDGIAFSIGRTGVQDRDGITHVPLEDCPNAQIRIVARQDSANPLARAFVDG